MRGAYFAGTSSAGFFGGSRPRYFITICRSFHASPFCRGSRNRNAGWYVTVRRAPGHEGSLLRTPAGLKTYQRPRSSDMGALIASMFFADTPPHATMIIGLYAE